MRIALVNHNLLPLLNRGLASIIATLRQDDHDVHLVDLAFTQKGQVTETVIDALRRISPEVIGISAGPDDQRLLEIISVIRKEWATAPILIGGVVPTFRRSALAELRQSAPENVWTFAGEANTEIATFLKDYERGMTPANHHIVSSPKDQNNYPIPDYRLFDMPRYFRENLVIEGCLPMYASQGCPFKCSFCNINQLPFSLKHPEKVVREILTQESRHRKEGLRCIDFHDPTFGYNKRHFEEMMGLFCREKVNERLPWLCETRPEVVTRDWAQKAARAGCIIVNLGLESSREQVRREILNRGYANEDVKIAAANLKEAGILYTLMLMAGVPGTSLWDDIHSVIFASSCAPASLHISTYYPAEGTPLGERALSSGMSPAITTAAHTRAFVQKLVSVPLSLRAGLSYHGFPYLKEVLMGGHCGDDRRESLLTQARMNPVTLIRTLHRPIWDLQLEKRLLKQGKTAGAGL